MSMLKYVHFILKNINILKRPNQQKLDAFSFKKMSQMVVSKPPESFKTL